MYNIVKIARLVICFHIYVSIYLKGKYLRGDQNGFNRAVNRSGYRDNEW